ncbi:hypothetical protein, partial [Klebsiella pneumoniae]|uniref:hypothetical protein n=1 Tax=Klebsiella pneumoniae TaxID=573 RepID=UPI001C6FE9CA
GINNYTLTCTHKLKSVQKIDIASGYKAIPVEHRYGYQSKIQAGTFSSEAPIPIHSEQSQIWPRNER